MNRAITIAAAAAVALSSLNIAQADNQPEAHEIMDWLEPAPITLQYNARLRQTSDTTVREGMEMWNGLSGFHVTYGGTTTRTARSCDRLPSDGISVLDWARIPGPSVAVSCWAAKGECDIRIDPHKTRDYTDDQLKLLVAHEVGHCAGLGHSDQPGALMYPYITDETAITHDDLSGLWHIYGQPIAANKGEAA